MSDASQPPKQSSCQCLSTRLGAQSQPPALLPGLCLSCHRGNVNFRVVSTLLDALGQPVPCRKLSRFTVEWGLGDKRDSQHGSNSIVALFLMICVCILDVGSARLRHLQMQAVRGVETPGFQARQSLHRISNTICNQQLEHSTKATEKMSTSTPTSQH